MWLHFLGWPDLNFWKRGPFRERGGRMWLLCVWHRETQCKFNVNMFETELNNIPDDFEIPLYSVKRTCPGKGRHLVTLHYQRCTRRATANQTYNTVSDPTENKCFDAVCTVSFNCATFLVHVYLTSNSWSKPNALWPRVCAFSGANIETWHWLPQSGAGAAGHRPSGPGGWDRCYLSALTVRDGAVRRALSD